jgi:hypothetical protein
VAVPWGFLVVVLPDLTVVGPDFGLVTRGFVVAVAPWATGAKPAAASVRSVAAVRIRRRELVSLGQGLTEKRADVRGVGMGFSDGAVES